VTASGWLESHYPESRFGGFTDVDGTLLFYLRVRSLLGERSVVVDVGCGRGAWLEDPVPLRREIRMLRGRCARVIGIDVADAGATNAAIDEFRPMRSSRWPLEDASVDLAVADHVLEHVEEPDSFFGEARRVLRPGGHLCIRTPNAWSYVAVAARLLPNRSHARVLARLQDGREERDVFPTVYRCNTARRLRALLARHGFEGTVTSRESEPSYLSFSRAAYALGVLHQRWAPPLVRTSLFAFARRSAG
jgi:SAM-dependent methyltransferase